MKRVNLTERLDEAIGNLYHNATVKYPSLESDYEQDLFNGWFEDTCLFEIGDLKNDEIFGEMIKQYGPVYQYGRGGRTLAPSKLVSHRGNPIRDCTELCLSPLEMRSLLKQLLEFNRSIAAWCKSVAEQWQDAVEANDWQTDIDENAGKRRKQVTVYR